MRSLPIRIRQFRHLHAAGGLPRRALRQAAGLRRPSGVARACGQPLPKSTTA